MGTESSGAIGNVNAQTGALWIGQSTYTVIRAIAIFVPGNEPVRQPVPAAADG
jgi:hypothetical protein